MSDIWSIFRKNLCIGVDEYLETAASFVFPLFPRTGGGVKTQKIYDRHS